MTLVSMCPICDRLADCEPTALLRGESDGDSIAVYLCPVCLFQLFADSTFERSGVLAQLIFDRTQQYPFMYSFHRGPRSQIIHQYGGNMSNVEPKKVANFLRGELDRLKKINDAEARKEAENIARILNAETTFASARQSYRRIKLEIAERQKELERLNCAVASFDADIADLEGKEVARKTKVHALVLASRGDGKPTPVPIDTRLSDEINAVKAVREEACANRQRVQEQISNLAARLRDTRIQALEARSDIAWGPIMLLRSELQPLMAEAIAVERLAGHRALVPDRVPLELTDAIYEPIYERVHDELADLSA